MNYTILIFNAAEPSYVGLWTPDQEKEWSKIEVPPGKSAGPAVFAAIEELLSQHNQSLSKVTHIGAFTGPASYTHLRIFIATANSLAWSLGIPIFAFDATKAMPESIAVQLSTAKLNVVLETIYPNEL